MIFVTLEFVIVLLLMLSIYWGFKNLHKNFQNFCLLFFNYAILLWINPYVALVVGIYTLCIYLMAQLLYTYDSKTLLTLCLMLVILNLAFFKYFSSIKDSFDMLFHLIGLDVASIDILFPLGISFYTFASITYLCESAKGKKPESLMALATFLSFFPTFISGPIMRSTFFFEKYHKQRYFGNLNYIFILIMFGVVKKVFLANYLQIYSDPILQNPTEYNTPTLLLGIYAYAIRLYCDFSGYVDLMCAFALMFGFSLPINFNMPYMAENIKDFWARWHISLSTFIRDYIYIPLGGNKKGFFLTQVFVLIAFVLSGIWHGNTYNFFIWGLLHGLGMIVYNCYRLLNIEIDIPYVGSIITFHFVVFTWIFFYYPSFEDAVLYLSSFWHNFEKPVQTIEVITLFCCCFLFLFYPCLQNTQKKCAYVLAHVHWLFKPLILAFCFILVIGFSPSGIPNFIYAGF